MNLKINGIVFTNSFNNFFGNDNTGKLKQYLQEQQMDIIILEEKNSIQIIPKTLDALNMLLMFYGEY